MDEIRNAAIAYYANLSEEDKQLSRARFTSVWDRKGNGKLTYDEYVRILSRLGDPRLVHPSFFRDLDRDGDGCLDYADVVTLWYVLSMGRLQFCYGCGIYLKGVYFTCVQCFCSLRSNCNVRCACYRARKFGHHQDTVFLDNYALLLRCGKQPGDGSTASRGKETDKNKSAAQTAVGAAKVAVGLANFLASVI